MGFSSARNLGRDILAGFSPPRRMPISEAVKKFMRVPKGAGNSVPWDPELTPYIIEPMNCLASREYDAVIFVGPARTGKTIGLIDGWIVYTIVCDPSDMLVVQMTEDKAREHSKKRLDRTFRSSAAVAASINIRPGHDYYFYVRSVNTVGKSAFVEAVGQPSDDASGYLDFFKGEIGKTHLAQELWTQIDNGQLAPDLAEIRTSITDVSNEITQTVNKKLEDQSAAIQQIQKVQVDTNNNLNSMWAVKLQQMQDGRLYIAGIGAGIENTPDGMQSQVLLAADRIAMVNPANGNTKPMFVGQGDQIFMNDVFLKRLTAPTITSGGNPPAFSLTPDGKLTAKNADISGNVNANSGTLNNVTINENCQIKGKLSANQIEGDIVKTVSKSFPRTNSYASGTITVRISDDQKFDRQVMIPPVLFRGGKHENFNSNNQQSYWYSTCRLRVTRNGQEIFNQSTTDAQGVFSSVIDMPAGQGTLTLTFTVSSSGANNWTPTTSISDLLVVVMKKSTAGISIS
ncbi:phage terminase large subunit family protein [Escherichia coli]|uniref:phage tail tip domain-containing protein n=1 Tax=Escherichia coli TaxID=562 RepID=UPI0015CE987D|nr:phage terminase large subunit family protein [Escherichia coli]EKG5188089.1 phage terminase large subunit family protein [Escherichia coli]EKP1647433.1 phage terminase large subunit family protein [Escherichia coli]